LPRGPKVNTFSFVKAKAKAQPPPRRSTKGEQTRQRIVDCALELFEQRGYAETTLRDISDVAGVAIGLTYRYFRRKEELALELYERLSEQVASRVRLPDGTIAERWAELERMRFKVLGPHRRTLLALLQVALDPESELGALSPATAKVRARWRALHETVIAGARGATPPIPVEQGAQVLYAIDLLLVVFWMQDRTPNARATRDAIERISRFVAMALALPGITAAIDELAATFSTLTKEPRR
jgi:AcrR family transcriptional regulator